MLPGAGAVAAPPLCGFEFAGGATGAAVGLPPGAGAGLAAFLCGFGFAGAAAGAVGFAFTFWVTALTGAF